MTVLASQCQYSSISASANVVCRGSSETQPADFCDKEVRYDLQWHGNTKLALKAVIISQCYKFLLTSGSQFLSQNMFLTELNHGRSLRNPFKRTRFQRNLSSSLPSFLSKSVLDVHGSVCGRVPFIASLFVFISGLLVRFSRTKARRSPPAALPLSFGLEFTPSNMSLRMSPFFKLSCNQSHMPCTCCFYKEFFGALHILPTKFMCPCGWGFHLRRLFLG